MKRMGNFLVVILSVVSFVAFTSCGGGGGGSSSSSSQSSTTKVTVNISQSKAASAQALPQEIAKIKITITGSGMTAVTKEVSTSGKQSIQELFDLPNGAGRCFLAEAFDVSGNVIYKGAVYADLNGIALVLDLTIVGQDTTPPSFSGLSDIAAAASTSLTLSWAAATDNVTPSDKIQYLIYGTTSTGTENYSLPNFVTGPGATTFAATGLIPDMNYCFVVRAMDEAGNIDTNTIEKCARTAVSTSNNNMGGTQKDTVAPTIPAGLTATPTGINRIAIGWNPSADNFSVSGYKVYRDGVYITTLTSTSWVNTINAFGDSSLSPNTQYCYAISALDSSNNESAQTVPVCATTPASFFTISSASICENNTACTAGTPVLTITFDSGTSPFFITSSNPQIIPNAGPIAIVAGLTAKSSAKTNAVSGSTYTLQPVVGSIVTDTQITLTVSDSASLSQDVVITIVNQPGLYTDAVNGKNQTGDGSSINPFRSISRAVAAASNNETINIAPGTYSDANGETYPITLKNGMHLQCERGVSIQASSTSATLLGPGAGKHAEITGCAFGGSYTWGIITDGGGNLIISGITIDCLSNIGTRGIAFTGGSFLTNSLIMNCELAVRADNTLVIPPRIINNRFLNDVNGIVINNDGQGATIKGNDLVYNGPAFPINTGIGLRWSTAHVTDNSIRNFNIGIAVNPDPGFSLPIVNYNNIYCNRMVDLLINGNGVVSLDAQNNRWDRSPVGVCTTFGTGCLLNAGFDIFYEATAVPAPNLTTSLPPITTPCSPGITK